MFKAVYLSPYTLLGIYKQRTIWLSTGDSQSGTKEKSPGAHFVHTAVRTYRGDLLWCVVGRPSSCATMFSRARFCRRRMVSPTIRTPDSSKATARTIVAMPSRCSVVVPLDERSESVLTTCVLPTAGVERNDISRSPEALDVTARMVVCVRNVGPTDDMVAIVVGMGAPVSLWLEIVTPDDASETTDACAVVVALV